MTVTVVCLSLQVICNKQFSLKNGLGVFTFSAISALFAALSFLVFTRDFSLPLPVLGFAGAFAVCCFGCDLFTVLAVKTGPLSRVALIPSFSLMIPTLYGILFLNEDVTTWIVLGLICLFLSIFLVNYAKSA